MTGRRRRAEDEFADERPWPADGPPGPYPRPGDAGTADRPGLPGQAASGYGTGPGGLRPGSRRGKHSAPPGPPNMPADPSPPPSGRGQYVPPSAGPPDSGPLPRVPRQGSHPGQYGAPADRPVVVVAVNQAGRDKGLAAGRLAGIAARALGGGGGGKDDVAQGGGAPLSQAGPQVVDRACDAVRAAVRDAAGGFGVR